MAARVVQKCCKLKRFSSTDIWPGGDRFPTGAILNKLNASICNTQIPDQVRRLSHCPVLAPSHAQLALYQTYRYYSQQTSGSQYIFTNDEELRNQTEDTEVGSFDKYGISEKVQQRLKEKGIHFLFPVQYETFEPTINGQDVVVQARTGTGKTLSFALPIVEKLLKEPQKLSKRGRKPRVLVLTPTRELAIQVKEDFAFLSTAVRVGCVYGGEPYQRQVREIEDGLDVVVGTPGRMRDLIEQNILEIGDTEHVILDEVDQMLDMGFDVQVEEIIHSFYKTDARPQTMMYSATMPHWVKKTAKKYLSEDHKIINLVGRQEEQTATTIEQFAIRCRKAEHGILIQDLIKIHSKGGRVIIFCPTKRDCEELSMRHFGKESRSLHGDISQNVRTAVIQGFKKNHFKILITTDVAARGLDIPDIELVVQTEPPQDVTKYIHRVGRSGRAGKSGMSILLYSPSQMQSVQACEGVAKTKFKELAVPTIEQLFNQMIISAEQQLNSVDQNIAKMFEQKAEDVLKDKGPVEAMSQALALISGANKYAIRSVLSREPGKTAMCYKGRGCRTVTSARFTLQKLFGAMNVKITDVKLLDRQWGSVFDVPNDDVDMILEEFEAVKEDDTTLERLTTLPPLQDTESQFNRFSGDRDRQERMPRKSRYDDRSFDSRSRQSYGSRSNKRSMSFDDVLEDDEEDFSVRNNRRYNSQSSWRSKSQGRNSFDDDGDDFERRPQRQFSSPRRSNRSYNNNDADDDDLDDIFNDPRSFRSKRKY